MSEDFQNYVIKNGKKLYKFFVQENNSGGYTKALGVLSDVDKFHYVEIHAKNADDAIHQFEEHFSLKGGSCNCCGRRFSLDAPKGITESSYNEYGEIYGYEEKPYYVDTIFDKYEKQELRGERKPGGLLKDAPTSKNT